METTRPAIELVVAMTRGGLIGRGNALPWRLREDLRRFRRLTTGHVLLAGRKTQESIGKPLPGRHTLVLSREDAKTRTRDAGVTWVGSLDEALATAERIGHRASSLSSDPVFCIGGSQIYRLALPLARALHITWVEVPEGFEGDVYFPSVAWDEWDLVESKVEEHPADARNEFTTRYEVFRRVLAAAS